MPSVSKVCKWVTGVAQTVFSNKRKEKSGESDSVSGRENGPEAFRAADEIFGGAAFYGEWVSDDAQSYHDVAVLFFSENRFRAGDMGFDG